MTKAARRYLEMYRELDDITDEDESAAYVNKMQPVWDALSKADQQQVRQARARMIRTPTRT